MLALGAFATALAYLVAAWVLVFEMRIGPVNVTLDEASGHGVHAGDVMALPLVALAVITFLFGVTALDRALPRRTRTPWRVAQVAPAPARAPVWGPLELPPFLLDPMPLTVAAA